MAAQEEDDCHWGLDAVGSGSIRQDVSDARLANLGGLCNTKNMNRYREKPGWIKLILIRKVTDIAAVGIEEKNDDKRFEEAFKGIPRHVWHVFEEPRECLRIIKDAVRRG